MVDARIAGPGIRYLGMARVLAQSIDVVLAVPPDGSREEKALDCDTLLGGPPRKREIPDGHCNRPLISGFMVEKFPLLDSVETPLVVDL